MYTHILPCQILSCLNLVKNSTDVFKGVEIDMGGGPGIIAHVIAQEYGLRMDNLELVEDVIKFAGPIVSEAFNECAKYVSYYVGSFDQIKRKNSYYDFCVAWDSIHHSVDPCKTLKEAFRVTTKGGYFVLVDRAHNNSIPQSALDRMTNIEYPDEFKIQNGIPLDCSFTRANNGEHEYRYSDWEHFFTSAGWEIEQKIMIVERHEKNKNYQNDFDALQVGINFELGGFERKKIVLICKKVIE